MKKDHFVFMPCSKLLFAAPLGLPLLFERSKCLDLGLGFRVRVRVKGEDEGES